MNRIEFRWRKRVLVAGVLFFILSLTASNTYGEWTIVNAPNVSAAWTLNSVQFTSPNEGWAVGNDWLEKGVLLHHSNGRWRNITAPNVNPEGWELNGVHFIDSTEGWAVGWAGSMVEETERRWVLLHYYNGSWKNVIPPDLNLEYWELYGVHFTSSNQGWVVGSDWINGRGVLLHYSDGSWEEVDPVPVSSFWWLNSVHSTSPEEGWAVGSDWEKGKGVLLHYSNGSWEEVDPPLVSSFWELNSVHFTSPEEGWAAGEITSPDWTTITGFLIHYSNGSWITATPPEVSSNWGINSVHFVSPNEGWAVGTDWESWVPKGVLLKYFSISPETISIPTISVGPPEGTTGTVYTYSAEGGDSNLGHPIQYQFDWGDGTNSGWLPPKKTSASKSWSSGGTFNVKAQARCASHNSVVSSWSEPLLVNIIPSSITLQLPSSAGTFAACTLISTYQPTFSWSAIGTFTNYSILFSTSEMDFSTRGILIAKANVRGAGNSWTPAIGLWKKIMTLSNNNGTIREVYWKVIGTMPDRTTVESEVRSLSIENPQPVTINAPQENIPLPSDVPPTFEFKSNCNVKFRLEFSPSNDSWEPKTVKGFTITTRDPNLSDGIVRTLTQGQWNAVRKLVGIGGYFRIKAWDAIKRETVSEVRPFTIQ